MEKDKNVQFLCQDCENYNRCAYYYKRKEFSYICKYFHLPDNKYKMICDRLYSWLNDMRYAIAPDENVTDDDERHDRLLQIDLIDELMEWMNEQEESNEKNNNTSSTK